MSIVSYYLPQTGLLTKADKPFAVTICFFMIIISAYDLWIGFMTITTYPTIEIAKHYHDVVWKFTFN